MTALLQAGERPGPAHVPAEAFGLQPAELTIDAVVDPLASPAAPGASSGPATAPAR